MRLFIEGSFLLIAGVAIGVSLSNGLTVYDFLLNLGTEIFGIVLTFGVVDYILEKRKLEESARSIAWEALNELDHAVWVWQGGVREFDLDELAGLLELVEESDPIPHFTQNLILRLGSRADNTLRTKSNILTISNDVKESMEILKHYLKCVMGKRFLRPMKSKVF